MLLAPGCKPGPKARAKIRPGQASPQQKKGDGWREYWEKSVGVTDKALLERIRQAENKRNEEHRRLQRGVTDLRNEIKVRATEGRLSSRQADSLVKETMKRLEVIERAGIGYWYMIDSLLTPEQRKSRVALLKSSTDLLMNRAKPAPRGDSFDLRGADTFGP